LVKIRKDHIATTESNKSTIENLEKENSSLKNNVKEFNDEIAMSASTSHVHAKPHNSFTHNKYHAKRNHNNKYTYNRRHDKHYTYFNKYKLGVMYLLHVA